MNTKKNTINRRGISLLLALAIMIGLIPMGLITPAQAIEDSSTFYTNYSSSDWQGSFESSVLPPNNSSNPSRVPIRHISASLDGEQAYALCYDRGLSLTTGRDTRYDYQGEIALGFARPFLEAYQWQLEADRGSSTGETAWLRSYWCGLAQVALWFGKEMNLTAADLSDPNIISQLAEDASKSHAVLDGNSNWQGLVSGNIDVLNDAISRSAAGFYGNWTFHHYAHQTSSNQGMIVATKIEETYPVYIKLNKVDAATGQPLAGAVFGVFENPSCTGTPRAEFTTTSDQWSISPEVRISSQSTTLYVKELSAPSGYKLSSAIYNVDVSATNNNTAEKAAAVFGGQPISNDKPQEHNPEAVISKVDNQTGEALAGAQIRLTGVDVAGQHNFITGTDGSIALQWADAGMPNYIAPGSYVVTEIAPPPGYVLLPDQSFPLELKLVYNSETGEYDMVHSGPIVFRNDEEVSRSIHLYKVDRSGSPLAGAVFHIYHNGQLISSQTTSSNGIISLTDVEPGMYLFVETTAPEGKVLPSIASQQIYIPEDSGNATYELTMTNDDHPDISIVKLDAKTGQPVANTEFEVMIDAQIIGRFQTNASGYIILDHYSLGDFLDPAKSSWTVTVTETNPSPGYLPTDPTDRVQTAEVRKGQTLATFVFQNEPYPYFQIEKRDALDDTLLPGADFEVKIDGTTIGTFTTGNDGRITIDYEKYGAFLQGDQSSWTFTVTEVSPPDGYLPAETAQATQTVELSKGQAAATVVFRNQPYPGISILKLSAETGEPLANAVFKITIDGTTFGTEKTDQNGKIFITYEEYARFLTSGQDRWTIRVEEMQAPSGYLVSDPSWQENELSYAQQKSTFVFYNAQYPEIIIRKYDSVTNALLPDTDFDVFIDNAEIGSFRTDSNGEIRITYEEYKRFLNESNETWAVTVKETGVPDGYFMATATGTSMATRAEQTAQLRMGQALTPFVYKNQPLPDVQVIKKDSKTDQPLAGVTYNLVGVNNAERFSQTTGTDGTVTFQSVPEGTYTLSEVSVPAGIIKSDETHTVVIAPGCDQLFTFHYENDHTPTLKIIKVDSITGDVLPGVRFNVSFKPDGNSGTYANIGDFTTDANGEIHLAEQDNLQTGWYQITELAPPTGYQYHATDGATAAIHLEGNEDYVHTVRNTPLSALIIRKIDSDTSLPVSGAAFRVRYLGGSTSGSGGTIIHEGVTSANGTIVLTGLAAGTYVVEEYRAAPGYELSNPSTKTVYISGLEQDVVEVEFANMKKGEVLIQKLDSVTKQPLAGATFKVTDSSGAVIGPNNGMFTTDAGGLINLSEYFSVGSTIVAQEITAPDGYVLDTTVQTLKIKENTTHLLTFYNTPIGGAQLLKLDEETRKPIPNVEFRIEKMNGELIGTYTTNSKGIIYLPELDSGWYTATETQAARGYLLDPTPHNFEVKDGANSVITITNRKESQILIHKVDANTGNGIYGVTFILYNASKNPIGQYTSDQDGYVFIDEGLEDGKYYLREIKAADGYILDDELKTIWVKYGTTTEIKWENTAIRGQIQIIKVSADDNSINGLPAGSRLEGAVFEIYDRAGNKVDTVVTDRNGRAVSQLLPLSRYTIKEVQAPNYYSLSDTILTAYLEHEGQIVTFEVANKSVSTGVNIKKTGPAEVMSNQPIKYTFTGIANTSSVPLSSFYWRDTLPAEVQLQQVVTGTYNQHLSYKIVYKTSVYGEYQTLADNLSTSQNYVLDASPAALGLASNERVTEVMFVFGTVKAGFAQVENPYIHGQTINGLSNGGSFVNVADVGGVHNGQWIMGVSRWTTKTYGKSTVTLPKTGY